MLDFMVMQMRKVNRARKGLLKAESVCFSSSLATGVWARVRPDAKLVNVTLAARTRGTVNKSRDSVAAARASREGDVIKCRQETSFLYRTT